VRPRLKSSESLSWNSEPLRHPGEHGAPTLVRNSRRDSPSNNPTAGRYLCEIVRGMTWVRWFRHNPSAVLFATQILGIVLYPAMGDTGIGRALVNAFGLVVVQIALWAVRYSPGLSWVGWLLAGPASVLLLIGTFVDNHALQTWSSGLEAGLYLYAAGCMLAYLLADAVVTRDELWAVGATFTLLAWAFAHAFVVLQYIKPGSFIAAVGGDTRSWVELLFLSITNLSSTGLSDVVPVRSVARSLVAIEQIVGVGYVVMLVSRVVALTVASANAAKKD